MSHLLFVLPWEDAGDLPLQFEGWLCSWMVRYGEKHSADIWVLCRAVENGRVTCRYFALWAGHRDG